MSTQVYGATNQVLLDKVTSEQGYEANERTSFVDI